jgi:hypothetical protein
MNIPLFRVIANPFILRCCKNELNVLDEQATYRKTSIKLATAQLA